MRFIYSKCSIRSDVVAVNSIHIWHGYIKKSDIECEKNKRTSERYHGTKYDTIPFCIPTQSRVRERENVSYIQIIKSVIQMCSVCVHMWYIQSEIETKDYLYINVDFKPSKEWQSKPGDVKEEREKKAQRRVLHILECVCFIRLMRWSESYTHIHTHTHTCCKHINNLKSIWWIMLGHHRKKEKYPSTNFKISDKLYAWASVIGLELHKTSELPAIGASMSVQFVTWLFFFSVKYQ